MQELCLSAAEALSFWERLAFNFLIGNGDAHGKNFSVLYRGGHCMLAPMYDIMSTTIYPEVGKRMAMKVDGEYAFRWMSLGKVSRQMEKLGLQLKLMERILKRQARLLLKKGRPLSERCNRQYPSSIYAQIVSGIETRCAQLGLSIAK